MVQNAGSLPKNGQTGRREKQKMVVIYLLFNLHFR